MAAFPVQRGVVVQWGDLDALVVLFDHGAGVTVPLPNDTRAARETMT